MPLLALLITIFVAMVTLANWRYGLLCVIFVGALQGVFRKLTPEIPAYYILWSLIVFLIVVVSANMRNAIAGPRLLWMGDDRLRGAFQFYVLVVLAQCAHSLVRWGSPVVPLAGAIFYLGPLVALLLVISFARQKVWLERYLRTYLLVMVPVCLTVYLSYWSDGSIMALKDIGAFVGNELIIYDAGTVLYSYPGLLRVGEIAAFHAATCIAFLSILTLETRRGVLSRVVFVGLIILLVGAIALTGRRKMLMTISIFWVVQFFLISVLRRGRSRQLLVFLIAGLAIAVGVGVLSGDGGSSAYVTRSASVFGDSAERLATAYDLFLSALNRSDGIGLGAGVASQAIRYGGVDLSRYVGGAAESGVGYLALEIGIPGLLAVGFLGYHMVRVMRAKIRLVAMIDKESIVYLASFIALLVANGATFVAATQLYGDYLVLITLGLVGGGVYSLINHATLKAALALSLSAMEPQAGSAAVA